MNKKARTLALVLALGAPLAAAGACGGGDEGGGKPGGSGAPKPPPPPGSAAKGPSAPKGDAGVDASPTADLPPLPMREFQESDFVESDRNRDPFRPFQTIFVSQQKNRIVLQRTVLVDRFALDELKLVGIVTRGPAKALLIDPSGIGWVAKVGDFVGKAELVHSGGAAGEDVALNWRVDRIRDDSVLFIREDPSHTDIAQTTRNVALYPVDQNKPSGPGH